MSSHTRPLFRALSVGLLTLIFAVTCAAQDAATKLDAYLTTAAEQRLFSGTAFVAQDGRVVLSKGYGMANIELDVANSPQTKFRLGSITKQFTAAAILLLQEQGKLSVQDPVCKFVTDCPPAWQPLTIHHLLTHSGGVPNFTSFPDYTKLQTLPAPVDSLLGRFRDKPLAFTPGEKFSYSNSGYVLLGAIIEKASGQTYGDFVRARIFEPLNMKNSGYDRHDLIIKNRATGYANDGSKWTNSPYLDMTIPHAAGALYSTVEDLYLWDQSLYSEKLLSAKSLALMFTPALNEYAYGWTVGTQFNKKRIGHGGGINGFATNITRYPEDKVTVIVLSNLQSANTGKLGRDLAAALFGEPYEIAKVRVVAKVDPKLYDAYVGKYQLAPDATVSVTRKGDQLFAQISGQPSLEIFPESETKFFLKIVDAQLTFFKDSQGKVTQLILHQGGDRFAKKIE